MSFKTATVLVLALGVTACNGLGNPGDGATDSSNPFTSTTAVPPWMGSDTGHPTTGVGGTQGHSTGGGGVSDSASSTGAASTGDAPTGGTTVDGGTGGSTGTGTSTGASTTDDLPGFKLDLPPVFSTGEDEDKDKDKDKDDD